MMRTRILCGVVFFLLLFSFLAMSQAPPVLDAADLKLSIDKLSVLGSVLYVGAHPDDENTAFLALMAKGRLVRTAYLSMTRGEGGQNLVGPEQGDELGVIRTQELLAARREDGATQFFTRAIDFGYSKTSAETMKFWGKEKILNDVVWVVRTFRPDVMVTRFTPTLGGHGNHTSSAILAEEAFNAAGDPSRFPEQLKYVKPWKPARLMFNSAPFFDSTLDTTTAIKVDLGEFNPLLGRSYTEIAGISRSNHKSQGFGAPQSRGSNLNYLTLTAGDKPAKDIFDGIDVTWSRIPGSGAVQKALAALNRQFDCQNPSMSIPLMLNAYAEMVSLPASEWVDIKKSELKDIIKAAAGLWLDALASDYSSTPGSEVKITASAINRSHVTIRIDSVVLPYTNSALSGVPLPYNKPTGKEVTLDLPKDFPYSIQYWLKTPPATGSYNIDGQSLIGRPENRPALSAVFYLTIDHQPLSYTVPVRYRWVDPVDGELYRPFVVVPAVALNLEERVVVVSNREENGIKVTLTAARPNVHGSVRLLLPQGWVSTPEARAFELKEKNDEKVVDFSVHATGTAGSGEFSVKADAGEGTTTRGVRTIQYKHIPPQVMLPEAKGKLVRLEFPLAGGTVGYIMGAGDEIPTALRQMGYQVSLLTDDELATQDLSRYDILIAGVRAYNTRPALRTFQNRMMEYVKNGGTYIVQYVTVQRASLGSLGPYPFEVSRDRVTDEDASVKFLVPNHPILNYPYRITEKDFEGWIQERGIYFADKWDPQYETILSCADPGESQKAGGLLYAHYGKGHYIFTGYVFFRELPAGVPGAYKLFSNILSVGRKEDARRSFGKPGGE